MLVRQIVDCVPIAFSQSDTLRNNDVDMKLIYVHMKNNYIHLNLDTELGRKSLFNIIMIIRQYLNAIQVFIMQSNYDSTLFINNYL